VFKHRVLRKTNVEGAVYLYKNSQDYLNTGCLNTGC